MGMHLMVLFAPQNYFHQDRNQINAFSGKFIEDFNFTIRMVMPGYYSTRFKGRQPVCKDISCNFFIGIQELAISILIVENQVPQYQQRPFVAKNIKGSAYRTLGSKFNLFSLHSTNICKYLHFESK